ncbi:hypothetical protein Bbelb_182990 [Branchiostoma belcheri]|nr:hypothetical protein Bbelb_182990 [Branchiostoma belcheri]
MDRTTKRKRGLYTLPSDPLTLEQKLLFHRYRRELVNELFTAPPSRLFHYLIGKGALTLPDRYRLLSWTMVLILTVVLAVVLTVVLALVLTAVLVVVLTAVLAVVLTAVLAVVLTVVLAVVLTVVLAVVKETAVNKAFLKRIAAKGERGYLAFCDGLRSRHGAWQGYLAELLEGHVMSMVGDEVRRAATRPGNVCTLPKPDKSAMLTHSTDVIPALYFLQLLKVVSLNIVQYLPQGWTRLVRLLNVTPRELETCKRQNKLRTHQVLHALMLWVGARVDQDDLIKQLLSALKRIHCAKVADLVQSLYSDLKQKYQDEEEAERGEGGEPLRVGEGEIQPCVRYSYNSTYFSSRGANPTRDLQESRRNRREKLRTIEAATHAEEMGKMLYRPESGKLSDRRSSDGDSGLGRERDSSRASSSARSIRDGAESRASTSEGRISSPTGSDPVVSNNSSPARISPEAVSLLKLGNIQEQEEDEHEEKLALNMV